MDVGDDVVGFAVQMACSVVRSTPSRMCLSRPCVERIHSFSATPLARFLATRNGSRNVVRTALQAAWIRRPVPRSRLTALANKPESVGTGRRSA